MSREPDPDQLERLRRLAALPDHEIDTDDLPVVTDWSHGVRGGTPRELRQKVAAKEALQVSRPTGGSSRTHLTHAASWEADGSATTQRNWYRYEFKVGNTVRHIGVTQDPRARELEHRRLWPTGRVVVFGAPVSACAAREWDTDRDRGSLTVRLRKG